VGTAGVEPAHLLAQKADAAEIHRWDALPELRIYVLRQPVRHLHDVTVGVIEQASFAVRHGDSSTTND
jgi:hypothetical protein